MLGSLLASSLARLLNFLRSVGHTKPNAAHCFCAVAFQGAFIGHVHWSHSCTGEPVTALLHRRYCIGVTPPACLHRAFLHQLSAASRCCRIIFHAGNSGQQHLPDGSSPQCRHPLRHGTPGQQFRCSAPASSISGTAPPPARSSRWRSATAPRPARNLIGTPCQQQTSSGGEKYSGLASNLAYLGRIC